MNIYTLTEKDAQTYLSEVGLLSILEVGIEDEIPPKWDDLARLYYLIRKRKPFQVLEFGSGFSTLIMAYALKENWLTYIDSVGDHQVKYKQPLIISLESSSKWRDNTNTKIKNLSLTDYATVVYSEVSIATHQGQICHFYDELPDVVPDFIYLDGPDPSTVKGAINGLSFKNPNRTVMAGDPLLYESTFLPGFFMIVDGRSNNARFLERMLLRQYNVQYHEVAVLS